MAAEPPPAATAMMRVRSGSRTIAVEVVGPPDGKPVLFVHGSPGCRLQARRLLRAAATAGVRLIALDRPGCGRTSAAQNTVQATGDMAIVLDHLGIPSVPVLAVSGGVAAALRAALTITDRVERVSLAAGLGLLTRPELMAGSSRFNRVMARAARRDVRLAQLVLGAPYLASKIPRRVLPDDERLREVFLETRETFAQGTRGPALDLRAASRVEDLHLTAVQHRVVAWHGTQDRYAPLPAMRELVQALPHATLHTLDGVDHFVFESHGDLILRDLKDVL